MLNRNAPLLDVPAARREADSYFDAIAAGRFSEATGPRARLEELGVLIVFQPGHSKAARRAQAEPARAMASADQADEAWAELRRALRRRDFSAATRARRVLRSLGFSVCPLPASTRGSSQTDKRERPATPGNVAGLEFRDGHGSDPIPPHGRTHTLR